MALTRLATAALPAIHKAVDRARLSVTAALTYPVTDRAGDYVEPAGIDWAVHKADPWVGLEHYRVKGGEWVLPGPHDNHLPPVTVGTARHPDTGAYAVELKAMPEGSIPFGTTYFDPSDRLSSQTFRLVEDGTLEGVSIEFTLRKGFYRELGPSPLEQRPAYHVSACTGLGWVHCATPVNPGALLLKSLPPHAERAVRVVQTGKVGAEPAHPLILKSLSRFAPGKSTTVTGGLDPRRLEKAMDEQSLTPAYEPEEEAAPDADAGPAGDGDELSEVYDHAQQIEDLAGSLEAIAERTASVDLIKDVPKLAAVVRAAAEKIKAAADKHQGKIDAARGGKDEPAEPAEDEAPDMEKDDDGVLKAMAPRHYKAVKAARVKRFSKAEVAAAPVVAAEPADPVAARAAQLAALKQSDPKAYARIAGVARDTLALKR